jgi:signal transduction histidine kinase
MFFNGNQNEGTNTSLSLNLKDNIFISCDEAEIEQVIINLINNSIDAIKDNNEKWIKVELIENSDLAVLSIIDSGPGIDEINIDKLFNPFFTTKSIGEGTGLGLSISKGIIDAHNGSIRINSNIKNTCFELRFNKVVIKNVA